MSQGNRLTEVAIDVGSSNIRICQNGKVVFDEPSCIVLHRETQTVCAFGFAAAELQGKIPPSLELIFPFRRGRAMKSAAAQFLLSSALKSIFPKKRMTLPLIGRVPFAQFWGQRFLCRSVIAISPSLGKVQEHFFEQVLYQLGFGKAEVVNKNIALLHRLRRHGFTAPVLATIAVGGMTTELALFAQDEIVTQRTIHLGGEDFTQEIIRAVRRIHHCEIGWQTAEMVKQSIAQIPVDGKDSGNAHKVHRVRGRDTLTSLPKTVQVCATDFESAFTTIAQDITTAFQQLCQDTSPELVTTAIDQGIFFTGGGSQLKGFAAFLMKKIESDVQSSTSPTRDIVLGL